MSTATDNGKWGSAPPTDKVVVRCQTCQQTQEWDDGTDGMAWAIQHSRETGHPDQYRVLTPDFPAGELAQLREKVDPDVEATIARLEQHVTDLEAERAQLREKLDAAEARRDDLARRILRMKEEADVTHTGCYTPVPLRWRHVTGGDVTVSTTKSGAEQLWHVTEHDLLGTWVVQRGLREHHATPDPDATVPVLVRHQEREALQTAREQLGATVVDRRV